MADGFIVRKGGITTEQALAPTITEVSTTETSITFNITNNDEQTAIIRHRLNDITDEGVIFELLTGETSTNIEITGLAEGTAFNVFATANVTEKIKSNVTEKQITTVAVPAPTITLVSTNTTSIVFTLTNNSSQTKDVTYGLTSPPTTTTISLASGETSSNQTFSGLTDTTDFTIFAQAVNSSIAEKQAQTLIPTPTITQVSKTETSITFTITNNSTSAADVVYDLVTPPEETTLQLAANTTSANQTISGLTEETTFTVFAQTKVAGFADSAIASSSVTTFAFIIFTAATGGTTLEYNSGGKRFRSHRFTGNGTFNVTTAGNDTRNRIDALVIAGGGAGGSGGSGQCNGSGGGGAGGFRTLSNFVITAQGFPIVVGGGGNGTANSVTSGANSSAFGIVSTGGGHGGTRQLTAAASGGSGGGGRSAGSTAGSNGGGAGISGQGNNGGTGPSSFGPGAGGGGRGGGGASAANGDTVNGGNGGGGANNALRTGVNEIRAGGGGGSTTCNTAPSPGTGGSGGGGNGGKSGSGSGFISAQNGAGQTGSGGGGQGNESGQGLRDGGRGGSGIVIIRYEIATV